MNGYGFRLRPLSTVDCLGLLDMLDRCSPQTLYERFLTRGPGGAPAHVRTLFADPDGYTVVAGGRRIVGFGSLFFDGPDEAEVALLVADAYQGRGVGTALAAHLCRYAAGRGVDRLRFTALAHNHRVAVLFRRCAPCVEFDPPDAGTVTATVRLGVRPALALTA